MDTQAYAALAQRLTEGAARALTGKEEETRLLLCALANVLTNPAVVLLNFIFPAAWLLLLLECAAVGVEGLVYLRCARRIRRPFLFALCANACSFGLGLVMGGIL